MHSQRHTSWIAAVALASASLSTAALGQAVPYGSGINPPGSLTLAAGNLEIGNQFQLSVRNTAVANPPLGLAFLGMATLPAPGFPGGLPWPGLGLASPLAPGELLIDLVAPNPVLFLGPVTYPGGAAGEANFDLSLPFLPSLIGLGLYAQGLLVTPDQGFSAGLTNGLLLNIAEPVLPGLVLIQPGTFQMGSNAPAGAPYFGASGATQPVHTVTLSRRFWMGVKEVTQAEYTALMGSNPAQSPGPDNPVERVSWLDAQAYCAALTVQQSALGKVPGGYQYRLPTEAEWEYACRAGTTTEFHYGTGLLCDQAKIGFSYHSIPEDFCNQTLSTVPVGSYLPNAWGLFDMHGNVQEWCLDSIEEYSAVPVTDPFITGGLDRVRRGGDWASFSNGCRSAHRTSLDQDESNEGTGFRVVLAPILVP